MSDFVNNLNAYVNQRVMIKLENEELMRYQLDAVQDDCVTLSVENLKKIVPIHKIEYVQISS